jgi:hypothetical protein
MFTITHSRLSFGQAVRAAKRAGSLRQYRRTSTERLAVVSGGTVLRYGNGYADHLPMEWMRPTGQDGATDAGDTQALRDRKWMVAND